MKSRFKSIKRACLRTKLHNMCKCRGTITAFSKVWGSFGVNDGNNHRILLSNVSVDNSLVDHVWIKSRELNNFKKYKKGMNILFDAFVHSYQKINGAVGIGLFDLKNIVVII